MLRATEVVLGRVKDAQVQFDRCRVVYQFTLGGKRAYGQATRDPHWGENQQGSQKRPSVNRGESSLYGAGGA